MIDSLWGAIGHVEPGYTAPQATEPLDEQLLDTPRRVAQPRPVRGLRGSSLRVLEQVRAHPGIRPCDLVALTHLSTHTVKGALGELRARGLVACEHESCDRGPVARYRVL